nr:hypothetical protein [Tanacetum cinerariifolium]
TLNHLMCMSYTDVAQVANAARNYEILNERDDEDTERPDKRQRSGDRHQPTSQQSSHRSHGQNNDRQGSDRRGGSNNHRSSNNNNNYSGSNNRQRSGDRHQPTSQQSSHRSHGQHNDRHGSDRQGGSDNHRSSNNNYSGRIPIMDMTRETGVISPTDLPILVLSSPGVPLRATPIQFALLVDVDTHESVVELQADKKPSASGRVFAITEDQANKTSRTITGTLFIYGHAVFVLFDKGATHSVISSAFASRITTTPTLLDHNIMLRSTVIHIELSLVTSTGHFWGDF